jgi:hypothetical protein
MNKNSEILIYQVLEKKSVFKKFIKISFGISSLLGYIQTDSALNHPQEIGAGF